MILLSLRTPTRWTIPQWTCVWLAFWALMFVATHVPMPSGGGFRIKHADKVVHFVMFFLLTWIGGRRLRASTGILAGGALVGWAIVYGGYAALDEWLQQWVGRSMTLGDWIADALGVAVASAVLFLQRKKPPLSEPPPPDP